jgi:hypothetical protein
MKLTLIFIFLVLLFNFTYGNINSTGNQQENEGTVWDNFMIALIQSPDLPNNPPIDC